MRRRWTEAERAELLRLRDVELLKWETVAAAMPGRTLGACQLEYYERLSDRNTVTKRPPVKPGHFGPRRVADQVRGIPAPAPAPSPIAQAPAARPSARRLSTHVLVADAELRGRIAERGLTAGLLGDPPAGRSALDQLRERMGEAAAGDDRRSSLDPP